MYILVEKLAAVDFLSIVLELAFAAQAKLA